jgi:hypothetical protein
MFGDLVFSRRTTDVGNVVALAKNPPDRVVTKFSLLGEGESVDQYPLRF